jgi:hypothetical protein
MSFKQIVKKALPYAPYLIASIVVLGPLLLPGFVLTMDMVFTPTLRMPDHVDNTWLFYAGLHVLNMVLPADTIQKLLLLAILLLCGVGTHRLLTQIGPKGRAWRYATYIGGLLYMINPFVYDRFMAGQYGVVLGYALLPWFCGAVLRFGQAPSQKRAVVVGLLVTVMSIVSIHSLGFVVVVSVVGAIAWRQRWRELLQAGWPAVAVFLVASAYWMVPTLLGQGRIAASLDTFTSSGRESFATTGANMIGQVGSVLGLMGFWQEGRSLFILPEDAVPAWQLIQLVVLLLIGMGVWRAWKAQRRYTIGAVVIGTVAIMLGTGVGGDWIAGHVPFFAGYREPQKFVALLALAYAFFMTHASAWLMTKFSSVRPVTAGLVIIVCAYTPTMLWGFYGQLHPVTYPRDWAMMNTLLQEQPDKSKVLFLPWHLYMNYGFAGRIIASPAPAYFDRPMIVSDDPELPGVAPQTRNATRETIQQDVLPAGARGDPIAGRLQSLEIGYVLVSKDDDYQNYQWLNAQSGIDRVRETQTLILYKVTNDTIGLHENN